MAAVTTPQPEPTQRACHPQDLDLLRRCLDGTAGAWDTFVARFSGLLAHVVSRSASQRGVPLGDADRDDLIAEVLIEILRNDAAVLRSFAGRASLPTYLTVIARRVAVRSLMRLSNTRRATGPLRDDTHLADRHDAAARAADREELEALLQRLDPAEAQIVRLYHLDARSYGEISRLTGMPLGSIGPTLTRARQKMREGA